jgi:hypothetical protein
MSVRNEIGNLCYKIRTLYCSRNDSNYGPALLLIRQSIKDNIKALRRCRGALYNG